MTEDEVTVVIAKCQMALFGRWVELNVTSYCLHSPRTNPTTTISFGLRNCKNADLRCVSFDGVNNGSLPLSRGRVSRGRGAMRQYFEQQIDAPHIIGELLAQSDLADGGVPAGRTVTGAVLRRFESIVETVRQHIRNHLSRDPGVRNLALATMQDRYGAISERNILGFLGAIDWRLMLAKAGCDHDQLNVIEYASGHNPPRFLSIVDEPTDEIPLIRWAPLTRFNGSTIANIKATALLRNVCGDRLGDEFESCGCITVEEQGYRFVIRPGEFVACTDPNGKTARLCIHTIGFACNPIDEVVIAFLHIKHKLAAYMREAIFHGAESGFNGIAA
ncbi:MAG: hypothetical protein ACXAC5_02200 [Promethearchaeota archaeon]